MLASIAIVCSAMLCLGTLARADEPLEKTISFAAFDGPAAQSNEAAPASMSFAAFEGAKRERPALSFAAFEEPTSCPAGGECPGQCACPADCRCGACQKRQASEPAKAKTAAVSSYPLRQQHWMINGDPSPSRETLLQHLQAGQHAGKWDATWLSQRTLDELRALHADDHEGHVQWHSVVRPRPKAAAATAAVAPRGYWQRVCNGNQCWNQWVSTN